jgi:RNA polymerase sigma-70 factor (ECF subfamily)
VSATVLTATLPGSFLASELILSRESGPVEISTDRALMLRVANGDADAFAVLYRRYERPIFGFLLRLAGRRAVAEDLLQETFTRVWLAAQTWDPARGTFKGWLYKVALNTARNELVKKVHSAPHLPLGPGAHELADSGRGAESLADELDRSLRASAVARALAELPDYMREVVVLRCSQQLSFAEIAEATGAPEGTLKARFHRAVAALRSAVGGDGKRR